jgi:hypothetical protein
MSFLDRHPVGFLDRLRPWFYFVAAMPALVLVSAFGPIDGHDAFLLIIYGTLIGDIDRRVYPDRYRPDDIGPFGPWNHLGTGEKLEYLLPAVLVIVLGFLVTTGMLFAGGTGIRYWLTLAGGLGVIAMGSWGLRRRWLNRMGAVESD